MKKLILVLPGIFILLFSSCKKSSSTNNTSTKKNLSVYLTDNPAQYSSVFIDIKSVEVKIDENLNHDSHYADNDKDDDNDLKDHDQYGRWDTLSIKPGIYDILKFRNGVDTLIATGKLPPCRIGKIRITLNNKNFIVISNKSYPLILKPGIKKYLYAKIVEDDLDISQSGNISLFIDFDAAGSIEEKEDNFYLKPVIKPFGNNKFGIIQGKVSPIEAEPIVRAMTESDTSFAIPNKGGGDFKFRGLKQGYYKIYYKGYNGYKDTTLKSISVTKGKETILPIIKLHK